MTTGKHMGAGTTSQAQRGVEGPGRVVVGMVVMIHEDRMRDPRTASPNLDASQLARDAEVHEVCGQVSHPLVADTMAMAVPPVAATALHEVHQKHRHVRTLAAQAGERVPAARVQKKGERDNQVRRCSVGQEGAMDDEG